MMGLEIAYYCPVCKEMKYTRVNSTKYMIVNGRSLADIRCKDCNTELFVEVLDGKKVLESGKRQHTQSNEISTDGFTKIIDELFDAELYSENDSEDYIINDVVNHLIKKTSLLGVHRHMISIIKIIEMKIRTKFNKRDESVRNYVVDNGEDTLPVIDRKYIYKKEDAEFDCTLFY